MPTLTKLLPLLLCIAAACPPALAQCNSSVENRPVSAISTEPFFTTAPETIFPGVGRVEFGWQQTMLGGGARTDGSGLVYKMGFLCNFEFRVSYTAWQAGAIPGRWAVRGIGDTWIGGQYRFRKETSLSPALAFDYSVKQPAVNSRHVLGSGQRDQVVALAAEKDFNGTSLNFEARYVLFGQAGDLGYSRHFENSFDASQELIPNFSLSGEIYSETGSSTGDEPLVSTLWSLSYHRNPRVSFDTGMDFGLTHGASDKRFFAGITLVFGKIYKTLKHSRPRSDSR